MKIFEGPIHGLLEAPHNPWATTCRIEALVIGDSSLRGLKVPSPLCALLRGASPTEICTLHLLGRRVMGVGRFGYTYYCEPALGLRAGLAWGAVAVAGVMLVPDANASLVARAVLASPFGLMMLFVLWAHLPLRSLRARPDAVAL